MFTRVVFCGMILQIMDNSKKKTVSFSQFQNWYGCPHRWYLDYVKRLKKFEDSLHMSFGTAIHAAMQLYLNVRYKRSEAQAYKIDLVKYFNWKFASEVKRRQIPHTPAELAEFKEDGVNIIASFRDPDNILKHFPTGEYSLLEIEQKVDLDIRNNVGIVAYLDLVFKNNSTGKIKIVDVKTATNGWNNYQKEDFTKTSQLVLYKALYSKKYNVPLSQIEVEFYIMKRKLYENSNYPQTHIQVFRPKANQAEVMHVINEFSGFLTECFTPNGEYRSDMKHPKIPGKYKKNCKFCVHKGTNCDAVPEVVNDD